MAKEETTVKNFKINYLSKEQYNQEKIAGRINDNEIYMTPAEKVTNGLDLKEELVARASTCPINFANEGALMYENGVYVAVECMANDPNQVLKTAYSTDGESWSLIDLPYVGNQRVCSCGGGKFIIISYQWNYDEENDAWEHESGKCVYSSDGINWLVEDIQLPQEIDVGPSSDFSVIFGDNKFYCIGVHPDYYSRHVDILSSSDGITWNVVRHLSPEHNWNLNSFSYANDKFILFAYDGFELYSTDGVVWNVVEIEYPYEQADSIQNVVYGNGKYVCCGGEGYDYFPVMVSDDGISWEYSVVDVSETETYIFIGGLTFGSNGFAILLITYGGSDSWAVWTTRSNDGIFWTPITEEDCYNPIAGQSGGES